MSLGRALASASVLVTLLSVGARPGAAQTVTIDRTRTYQTIEGFGFFGGMNVWWSSGPFHDPAWLATVIDDLGMTIHRNEYYSEEANQDADWDKQKGLIEALAAHAQASKEPLKFIWTVWSPPSSMKSNHSLKNGGTLLPENYAAFGDWLVQGIDNYAGVGVSLYALSPQNEPLFVEPYNSCVYTAAQYRDMLEVVGPIVKAAHPDVKIFGAEHMLFGVGKDYDWNNLDPAKAVLDDASAAPYLDRFACHGYGADGATPTPGSTEAQYWSNAQQRVGSRKPIWMTETSGYPDTHDGAMDYALSIHAALAYGHAAAWLHWQGSAGFVGADGVKTRKYCAAKHFYRFVRPGAERVSAASSEADLFVTAFDHRAYDVFTVVLINAAATARTITLAGEGLPAELTRHRTTSAEGCAQIDVVSSSGGIELPARSITTLVSGDVYGREGSSPPAPDAGPADGAPADGALAADAGVDGAPPGGTPDGADGLESGCGCAAGSRGGRPQAGCLLLLAVATLAVRRRRPGGRGHGPPSTTGASAPANCQPDGRSVPATAHV